MHDYSTMMPSKHKGDDDTTGQTIGTESMVKQAYTHNI